MEEYPELLNEYLRFCSWKDEAIERGKIDLSNLTWVYPTEALPLIAFLKNYKKVNLLYPQASRVHSYLESVFRGDFYTTSMPISDLPKDRSKANIVIEKLEKFYKKGKGLVSQAFFYFIEEILNNIYDHSLFSDAYIFAQAYPIKKFSEIAIIDDGISIPGSYQRANYNFDDSEALLNAIAGVSTKDHSRGYGLKTTTRLITEGLNGEILIVSRSYALHITKSNKKLYKLQNQQWLQGTLVSIRIPYPAPEADIYGFVE